MQLHLPSTLQAAILIVSEKILASFPEKPKSVRQMCSLLECSHSQAYEVANRLLDGAEGLFKPVGRPVAPVAGRDDVTALLERDRNFLRDNPGAVTGGGVRQVYSVDYRNFVIGLRRPGQPGASMTVAEFARWMNIPEGTMKSWLQVRPGVDGPESADDGTPLHHTEGDGLPSVEVKDPQIATVVHEFDQWKGTFESFVKHVNTNLRLPFGKTLIATILDALGRRSRRKRPSKNVGMPGQYKTFFPGFQWAGDGKRVIVEFENKTYAFNFEIQVDVATDAIVGVAVTDTENEDAVIEAYEAGKATTGKPAIALSVDNRPSNHTTRVSEAVHPTELLPTTPGRPTSNAVAEGAFGLFAQELPVPHLKGLNAREVARSSMQHIIEAYAIGRNGRPRTKLGGRPPAEAYLSSRPTEEEIRAANEYLTELKDRQNKIRQSMLERTDPVKLQLLEDELSRLELDDPRHANAMWLARYSLDAIVLGLATFEAKLDKGTVPHGADPLRYLGGIIRNINDKDELDSISEHLLRLRLRQKEMSLQYLQAEEARIRAAASDEEVVEAFANKALDASAELDSRFWASLAKSAIASLDLPAATAVYKHLSRCIARNFHASRARRTDLIAALAAGD